jgi:hypothetical protein
MKNKLILVLALIGVFNATLTGQAQYTFAPQVQSTNTASITYNSGANTFQYTDAPNLSADFAGLPLAGNAAAFITTTNEWTAWLSANLSARSMPGNGSAVNSAMGLYVVINSNGNNNVKISLDQVNNTGDSGNFNTYGTMVLFEAVTNNQNLATTPLGNSGTFPGGTSYQLLSGGTNSAATAESINAASGVLTLTNDAAKGILTGYYNGSPVGSISLASWGPHPSLSIAVVGFSAYGVNVPAGTDTASNFFASPYVIVSTTALPGGTNGVAYNQTLAAFGGQPPYSWTNISGALPPGLMLATNGVISGTPTISGTFDFTARVTDAINDTATQPLTLAISRPPGVVWIQPTNNSVAVPIGSNVSFSVAVAGTGPFSYQWQFNGTNLPNNIITTAAGNGIQGYSGYGDGGAATNAEFVDPRGIALDATGNLLIADVGDSLIREVGTNGVINTVADGSQPTGVEVDSSGNLFIANNLSESVGKVSTNGTSGL